MSKKIVCRNIDLMSVFKLIAGMSFVLGFIIALFGGGLSEEFAYQLKNVPFIGSMLTGFLGAILFGVFAALLNGLMVMICAVLYNLFAMIFGGVEIDIDEK